MADTQSEQREQQQQGDQRQQDYGDSSYRAQPEYDAGFWQQVSGSTQGTSFTTDLVRQAFDQSEQAVRHARQVAERQLSVMILGEAEGRIASTVAAKVRRQVIEELRANPQLLKQIIK